MGIKPFIGTMIYMMPMMFILYFVWFAAFFVVGFGTSILMVGLRHTDGGAAVAGLLVAVIFVVVFIALMAGTIALMYPLKAVLTAVEVTGKFEYAWKFKEILAYLRTLRPHYLKAFLGFQVGSMICMFLGVLCCYVGMFPAMTIAMAANAHVRAQLYRIYLARGGAPFPWGPEA
jgi:hypothetical protein